MPTPPRTVTQIVLMANQRTQNLAAKKLDVNAEFWLGMDEFCGEKHYWWRRKLASFTTVIGTQTYDLTVAAPTGPGAIDLEEIEEMFVVNSTVQCSPGNVRPAFYARDQIAAAFGPSVGPFYPRSGYFVTPGSPQQLQFTQPVTQQLLIGFSYWALPMQQDNGQDAIPLVPVFLQYGLLDMLLVRLYEFLYGQEDPRYQTSLARYNKFVMRAAKSQSFSSQRAIHASSTARAVIAHGRGGGGRSRY
jgi:hypothetical protein